MSKTAVEFYRENLFGMVSGNSQFKNENDIFEQALAIEREQHGETWLDSSIYKMPDDYIGKEKTFDQYYEQKYRKEAGNEEHS